MRLRTEVVLVLDHWPVQTKACDEVLVEDFIYMIDEWVKTLKMSTYTSLSGDTCENFSLNEWRVGDVWKVRGA